MVEDSSVFRNSKHQYSFEIDCSGWCPEVPAEVVGDEVFAPGRVYSQVPDRPSDEQWAIAEQQWPSAGEAAELHLTLRVLDLETLAHLKVALDSLKGRGVCVDVVEISGSH